MLKLTAAVLTLWVLHAIGVDGLLTWVHGTNEALKAQFRAYEAAHRPPGFCAPRDCPSPPHRAKPRKEKMRPPADSETVWQ